MYNILYQESRSKCEKEQKFDKSIVSLILTYDL